MKAVTFLAFLLVLCGCSKDDDPIVPPPAEKGDFSITAPFDSIRSYAGGGGLFLVVMTPGADFKGATALRVEADPELRAALRSTQLTASDTVSELLLRPSPGTAFGGYPVTIVAAHAGAEKRLRLNVDVLNWGAPDSAAVLGRLEFFRAWCMTQYPDAAAAFAAPEFVYNTYPEILIVEHHTILTPEWEIRMCRHVMVPPHDWMKIRFRRRGSIAPLFAAVRESDGGVHEIPVAEYPVLCGF